MESWPQHDFITNINYSLLPQHDFTIDGQMYYSKENAIGQISYTNNNLS